MKRLSERRIDLFPDMFRPSPRIGVGILAILLVTLALMTPAAEAQSTDFPHKSWMKDLAIEAPEVLDQTLARFIFPGTHDSGTYDLKLVEACSGCPENSGGRPTSTSQYFRSSLQSDVLSGIR